MRFRKALLSDVEFSEVSLRREAQKRRGSVCFPALVFFPVLSVIRRIRHTRLYHGAF